MSYRKQEVEWDVPASSVSVGTLVGFEVELSQKSGFSQVAYKLSTFDETTAAQTGTFFYSLDDGVTWIDFPSSGVTFSSAYKMKVVINAANVGYIFAERDGVIYRLSGDLREELESFDAGVDSFQSIGVDRKDNLYLLDDFISYSVDTNGELSAGNNPINLLEDTLGVAVDSSRGLFWQVSGSSLYLRSLTGEIIDQVDLPSPADFEFSSSSSSSSSSSLQYSSSSSSSSSSKSSSSSSSWFEGIGFMQIGHDFIVS